VLTLPDGNRNSPLELKIVEPNESESTASMRIEFILFKFFERK
jgi:hypothetical protein